MRDSDGRHMIPSGAHTWDGPFITWEIYVYGDNAFRATMISMATDILISHRRDEERADNDRWYYAILTAWKIQERKVKAAFLLILFANEKASHDD